MLIDMWDTILNDLDKGNAASCLVSLDFEKAFDRLDHNACMHKGGSAKQGSYDGFVSCFSHPHIFARQTDARARVGLELSRPMEIKGVSPQGSILGGFLFTITTDNLSNRITYDRNDLNGHVNNSRNSQDTVCEHSVTNNH